MVGSELNISPEIWRSARAYAKLCKLIVKSTFRLVRIGLFYTRKNAQNMFYSISIPSVETSPVEATLNDMGKDLQLTSAQSERLQFLSSLDSTSEFDVSTAQCVFIDKLNKKYDQPFLHCDIPAIFVRISFGCRTGHS